MMMDIVKSQHSKLTLLSLKMNTSFTKFAFEINVVILLFFSP